MCDDRIFYNHWRLTDPEGTLLSIIHNICLKYRRIPSDWKVSRTVLVLKNVDPDKVTNYRPISFLQTI